MRRMKLNKKDFAVIIKSIEQVYKKLLVYDFYRLTEAEIRENLDSLNIEFELIISGNQKICHEIFSEEELKKINNNSDSEEIRSFSFNKNFAMHSFICDVEKIWFEKEGLYYTYKVLDINREFSITIPSQLKKSEISASLADFFSKEIESIQGNCVSCFNPAKLYRLVASGKNTISHREYQDTSIKRRNEMKKWKEGYDTLLSQAKLMPKEEQSDIFLSLEALNKAAIARINAE